MRVLRQPAVMAFGGVIVAALASSAAIAQLDPCPNHVGIYFDEGATLFCTQTAAPFQSVTAYLCVTNLDEPSGVSGWECTVEIVGAGLIAPGWEIRHGGTNFLTAPQFAVGIGTFNPAPWAPSIVLASMTGFVQMPGMPVTFAISAAPNPSIPGHNGMVVASGDDATNLIAINPSAGYTGGVPNVCAGINYCDITIGICDGLNPVAIDTIQAYSTLGDPESPLLGEEVAIAGTVTCPNGLLGSGLASVQDETGGIIVSNLGSALSLGERVSVRGIVSHVAGEVQISQITVTSLGAGDVISPLASPISELQDYERVGFLVTTSGVVVGVDGNRRILAHGSDRLPVVIAAEAGIDGSAMTLGSNFAVAGILRVQDREIQLWPRWQSDLVPSQPAPYDFTVTIDVLCGDYSDNGNVLGTLDTASDGFDFYEDTPEPPHPPANYLSAYFDHPEWGVPVGAAFSRDIRAPYELAMEKKVWPLTIETDRVGTATIAFAPSFPPEADHDLVIEDLATGQITFLYPSLVYTYASAGPTPRHFLVHVGRYYPVPALEPVSRDILAGWSLIGMPLQPAPGAGTAAQVVLNDAGGPAWLFRYIGAAGYASVPGNGVLAQGVGYWLACLNPFTWTMEGQRDIGDIDVPLVNGWTLLGYPLWFPLGLDALHVIQGQSRYSFPEAISLGLVAGNAYGWDTALAEYTQQTELAAWRGYWLAAYADGLTLRFNYRQLYGLRTNLTKAGQITEPRQDEWAVTVQLTDQSGRRSRATVGVSLTATDGFDAALDLPVPPPSPIGPAPTLALRHDEWHLSTGGLFATDIRGAVEKSQIWPGQIAVPSPGSVTLSWSNVAWPEGVDLNIYLPAQNRVVVSSMRRQQSVTIDVGPEPLAVEFRTPDHTTDVPAPVTAVADLYNVPNPFNPGTTIYFGLPRPGVAEVRIYDPRGRVVRRLLPGWLSSGESSVAWDGRDEGGTVAASGLYFVHLYLDGERVGPARKMSLVK